MGLVVVVVPLKPAGARGMVSRWLPEIAKGVYAGELPRAALERLRESLVKYNGVQMMYSGGQVLHL